MIDRKRANDDDANSSENLLTPKNLSLVALPWLLYQKKMLQKAKTVNDEAFFLNPLVNAAVGSQVGLIRIMKQQRLGKIIVDLMASQPEKSEKRIKKFLTTTESIAARSNEFLKSYEVILDATIAEFEKQQKEGEGTNRPLPKEEQQSS